VRSVAAVAADKRGAEARTERTRGSVARREACGGITARRPQRVVPPFTRNHANPQACGRTSMNAQAAPEAAVQAHAGHALTA